MNGPGRMPARVRDRIFDAVLGELVESGIDAFSLADVARRAGVKEQVIERHWRDRRVLLMEAMLARVNAALPTPDEGSLSRDLGRFVGSLAGLTGTGLGRKWFRRLLPGGRDADLSNVGPDFWSFEMAAVEQMFDRAAERGELRSDIDPGNAARMLVAALVYDMVFNDSPMDRDYADQAYRVILQGVLGSSSDWAEDLQDSKQTLTLLRAAYDGTVDPTTLLEAVRDSDGGIIDFVFREVNPAACTYLQRSRTELLGARATEVLPELVVSGLLIQGVHAMQTGEPLAVEDFRYFSRRYDTIRRFDVRGMPVSADWLSMVWRDVSDRHRTQQQALDAATHSTAARTPGAGASPDDGGQITAAEALRAAADSLLDPQVLLEADRDSTGEVIDFVYRDVNQATCDYLGMARADILGRGAVEMMPGLKGTLFADYVRCLKTGEPLMLNDFTYDNEILGGLRRYELRVTRSTPTCLTLTWRDITDRFQAEQDLTRSRDLLRSSADAMFEPQALVEVLTTPAGEVDLVLRDVNRAFYEYLGLTRSDLVGRSVLELFPNAVGSGMIAQSVNCAEAGEPVILDDVEYFAEFMNEPRRFDIRATQVDFGLITVTVRDATERFDAAQRLAASEEKYRLLAENTGDLVTHIRDGKIVWASPSAEQVLGAPAEHWIGRDAQELIPAEDRSAFADRLASLGEEEIVQQRLRIAGLGGQTHWTHLHAQPFYDADGHSDGASGGSSSTGIPSASASGEQTSARPEQSGAGRSSIWSVNSVAE